MYDITEVIMHRPPMLLLDKLLTYDEQSAECAVNITNASPFYKADAEEVPSYVAVEYMAQAIAAYAGANDLDDGNSIRIGFLLGTRRFESQVSGFKPGQKLKVLVNKLYQEESGLSVFDCQIVDNTEVLCSANVNVFQPENAEEYIAQQ